MHSKAYVRSILPIVSLLQSQVDFIMLKSKTKQIQKVLQAFEWASLVGHVFYEHEHICDLGEFYFAMEAFRLLFFRIRALLYQVFPNHCTNVSKFLFEYSGTFFIWGSLYFHSHVFLVLHAEVRSKDRNIYQGCKCGTLVTCCFWVVLVRSEKLFINFNFLDIPESFALYTLLTKCFAHWLFFRRGRGSESSHT